MKIALVHELLTMRGGAERVLKIVADMFPEAPIYTLLYNERKLGDWFEKERVIVAKNFQFSIFNFQYNHHLYLKHFPRMVESWDFSEYDIVLSFSSAFTHGIITNSAPKHLCYVHAPARYLWDRTHDVISNASKGILGPLKKAYLQKTFHKLRLWDAEVADRPDKLLAASKNVQRRIKQYWRRESDVVYPPISNYWLNENTKYQIPNTKYFLIVSTLVRYKNIDLAIKACAQANVPLKIVGEGSDLNRLKSQVSSLRSDTYFLGHQSNDTLKDLYTNAQAVLFPGIEDFGLVPLEAMACGTPVIAYRGGGALETIVEGKTGAFFDEQTPVSLAQTIKQFDPNQYDEQVCKDHAKKFSEERFKESLKSQVSKLIAHSF